MSFFGRTSQKMLNKIGKGDKTVDEEFQQLKAEFRELSEQVNNAVPAILNYIGALQGIQATQVGMGAAMFPIYDKTPLAQTAADYGNAMESIAQEINKVIEKLLRDARDNLLEYAKQFPEMETKISARKNKQLDFDRARNNYITLAGKSNADPIKLAAAESVMQQLGSAYEITNEDLKDDLCRVLDSHAQDLSIVFETIMQAQDQLFGASLERLSTVARDIDPSMKPGFLRNISFGESRPRAPKKALVMPKVDRPATGVSIGQPTNFEHVSSGLEEFEDGSVAPTPAAKPRAAPKPMGGPAAAPKPAKKPPMGGVSMMPGAAPAARGERVGNVDVTSLKSRLNRMKNEADTDEDREYWVDMAGELSDILQEIRTSSGEDKDFLISELERFNEHIGGIMAELGVM